MLRRYELFRFSLEEMLPLPQPIDRRFWASLCTVCCAIVLTPSNAKISTFGETPSSTHDSQKPEKTMSRAARTS
jgi:hypothetical protein